MLKINKLVFFLSFLLIYNFSQANTPVTHFMVMPLGTSGGELEDNLSSYLVAAVNTHEFVALDAGTLCSSIKKIPLNELKKMGINVNNQSSSQTLLTQNLKAYLISHAHLDHVSGLVMCSTIDNTKEIMGRDTTINYIRDYIFNNKIWPNFGDEGELPQVKRYHYVRLELGRWYPLTGTPMKVSAYPLSHGNSYPSTAFLLEFKGSYLLYFGDTGADSLEHSEDIRKIWKVVAPLIRSHRLKAIFIEASYSNERPDNLLFGHLTPHWLESELQELAKIINPADSSRALQGLNVVITHIKQGFELKENAALINQQLKLNNKLGLTFIIPKQFQLLYF